MLRYGVDYIDAGELAYELQFQNRRLAGLKEAARAMGYALMPSDPPPTNPTALG